MCKHFSEGGDETVHKPNKGRERVLQAAPQRHKPVLQCTADRPSYELHTQWPQGYVSYAVYLFLKNVLCVCVCVSEAPRLTDSSAESPLAADRPSFTPDGPICTQSDTDTQSPSQSAHSPFVMSDRLSETTSQVIGVIVSKWPQCNGHKLPALRSGDISLLLWWKWKPWEAVQQMIGRQGCAVWTYRNRYFSYLA